MDDSDQQALQSYNTLSSDSFYAQNPLMVEDVVPINDPTPINTHEMEVEDDNNVDGSVSNLADQVAMESVEEHLRKINQPPSGLKDRVESDLIRRITSVKPDPIADSSATSQDILVKHRGSPTPATWHSKARWDPLVLSRHQNKNKSITFLQRDKNKKETNNVNMNNVSLP